MRDFRESTFGVKDKQTENVDVKMVLVENEDGGMKFWVNGQYERFEDPSYVEAHRKQHERAQE